MSPLGSVQAGIVSRMCLFLEQRFLSISTVYFYPGLVNLPACVTRENHSPVDQNMAASAWPRVSYGLHGMGCGPQIGGFMILWTVVGSHAL